MLVLVVSAALAGCSSESPAGSGSSGSASTTSTDDETSTAGDACSRTIEGDLIVLENTDIDEFRDVVAVTGRVAIGKTAQTDLSFLSCLESIGTDLDIGGAGSELRSTRGMPRLRQVGSIHIVGSSGSALTEVDGLEGVSTLEVLSIGGSSELTRVNLPRLESARILSLGGCRSGSDKLVEIRFDDLASLERLTVGGNASLTRLDLLDALIANGASPLEYAEIMHNEMLPETSVTAALDQLGVAERLVCGNLDGEPCECPID